ncbi:hypothetical protein ACRRTK_022936 [Alexandromys fortis]
MGLTKQYLRYVPSAVFGLIGSQKGNIVFVTLRGEKGRYVAVPACEHVFIWDLRKGEKDTDVIIWDVINESGLYRLKGHKDAVTHALFLRERNLLVTSGKDTMVKWWDLDNQHCFKTMVGHRTEVWGLVLVSEEKRLITGAADSELRAWDIAYLQEIDDPEEPEPKKIKEGLRTQDTPEAEDGALEADEASEEDRILSCRKAGSIMREGRDRVVSLAVDKTGRILACHGNDSVLEVFCILSKAEVQKKMDKKLKKARKKAKLNTDSGEEDPETSVSVTLQDEIHRVANIKTSSKIKSTLQCIRTMPCEYALCSFFVPGDRQVVIGTKTGNLQLFDLASGNLLETVAAHDGALWSMSLSPDQRGFVTGGADKTVKFWDFELVTDKNSAQKRLSVKHTRTLQLDEDVLCVSYSPNQKLLAVSLLDCTVKVFYVDTLKDGALIATGSADRNVKIWGLDFGDCHRSLFAHDDSVMHLRFVPKSHLFFTAGKDRKIKQWDADKFEHIQTLEGHHQEIWCLAVSPSGDYVVSASHDKSLRLWERTREPLILEEEREMQREAEYEESVAKEDQPAVPGETQGDSYFAGKKTIETVKAAERIMEAIELYREETAKIKEHRAICRAAGKEVPLPVNPILMAYGNISPSAYVLEVIKGVKSSELEEALLVLPFSYVPDILSLLNEFIQMGTDIELLCRCLFFLLRIHFGQITSNQMLVPVIEKLKETTISKVRQVQDVIGFNMAGLDYLKRECEAKSEVTFFAEATGLLEEKKRKRRNRRKMILTLT